MELYALKLFEEAASQITSDELHYNQGLGKSLEFLAKSRKSFEHRFVLFLYSNDFNALVANELLRLPPISRQDMDDLKLLQLFLEKKADNVEDLFKALVCAADRRANRYTCALFEPSGTFDPPLVWKMQEGAEGISQKLLWWVIFRFLCEIADLIVLCGGVSEAFIREVVYLRNNPHLWKRAVWMDSHAQLHATDTTNLIWKLDEITFVIDAVEKQHSSND